MNTIAITGRLTRPLELKQGQSGKTFTRFCVAVDRPYGDETDFIDCTAFGKTAEFMVKYLGKGRKVGVVGSLQSSKYTDRDGNSRTSWQVAADRVEALDPKPKQTEESDFKPVTDEPFMDALEDEGLPFN